MKTLETLMTSVDIYTIDRLNSEVKACLEARFSSIWVEGEVSNLARPASGHLYFTLKNDKAQVRCALFRFSQSADQCPLENGMQILARAKVSVYEGRGDYQLIVNFAEPLGDGKLRLAYEALKQKLSNAGLFDAAHKKALPEQPKCIGIVTSKTGAAIRDIISVMARRFPWCHLIIYPTLVQGPQSAIEITRALQLAIRHHQADVLILARGGGSMEDLWGFNDEQLARTIYDCPIPIVTGIGHEIDFTIADFVADVRAPTPSAAAELLTPDMSAWMRDWQRAIDFLRQQVLHQLQIMTNQLLHLTQRLNAPLTKIQHLAQRLDHTEQQLKQNMRQHLQSAISQLERLHYQLRLSAPNTRIREQLTQLPQLLNRLIRQMQVMLQHNQVKLAHLSHALDTISPLATLARGYSIASDEAGKILISAEKVALGDEIQVRLHRAVLGCQITQIKPS